MSGFSKDELSFVKDLPEHVEVECPVCLNVLTEPHLVTCCGHNFCESCILRIRSNSGPCPMCKETNYQSLADKKCLRIIRGLQVYCTHQKKGCQWKGELKDLSTHLNKGKREGECQYEEVECQYKMCLLKESRCHLDDHEQNECFQRPYQCQFCKTQGTYRCITNEHCMKCSSYPVPCPNKCTPTLMSRQYLDSHLALECPLQPVNCSFSWAGCNEKPLRKNVEVHTMDSKHMTLLAIACGQLKKENEELKEGMDKVKEENKNIKEENALMKMKIEKENKVIKEENEKIKQDLKEKDTQVLSIFHIISNGAQWLLPIDIVPNSGVVHFYTNEGGHHMSACLLKIDFMPSSTYTLYLAFHAGIFDRFQPTVPQIFGKYKDKIVPLIEDTDTTYEHVQYNALNEVTSDGTVPSGVLKKELGESLFIFSENIQIFIK